MLTAKEAAIYSTKGIYKKTNALFLSINHKKYLPMRTLLFTLCCLFICLSGKSQVWLELGPKANYGLTGYYNSNIADDKTQEFELQASLSYGAALGLNFGSHNGINLEAMLTQNEQTINFTNLLGMRQNNILSWETIDVFLLYRFYTDRGAYLEVGPKYSLMQSVEQSVVAFPADIPEDSYNENYISAALGFGGFIMGSRAFTLKMGLRLEYAMTDMVTAGGSDVGYPTPYTQYDGEANTSPYRASIGLELSFGVGGIARSVCGRRSFMFGNSYR